MIEEDPALVRAWTEFGDGEAFRHLYDRHAPKVYAFARGIIGAHLAEEAVQDTFLRASEKMAQYRGSAEFSTWLLAIARNVIYDLGRREKKRRRDLEYKPPEKLPLRPDETLESRELTELIREAVNDLPAEHREAIVLCHLEGYRVAQAAQIMDIPEGTVKSYLHRGRETLKQALVAQLESWSF